jgi:hypothetical protein
MRRLLAVLVVTMLVYPVTVRAQASCDKCEHLCMWAPLVTSAEKTKLLYENANVVFGDDAKDVKGLEQDVNGTMLEWKTTSDAESPCYQIILKEYLGGDDPNVILPDTAELDRVITHLPPSGNLFHVAYDKRGCPIEDNQGKPFDRKKLENQM